MINRAICPGPSSFQVGTRPCRQDADQYTKKPEPMLTLPAMTNDEIPNDERSLNIP